MLVHRSFRSLGVLYGNSIEGFYVRTYVYAAAKTAVTKNCRSGEFFLALRRLNKALLVELQRREARPAAANQPEGLHAPVAGILRSFPEGRAGAN